MKTRQHLGDRAKLQRKKDYSKQGNTLIGLVIGGHVTWSDETKISLFESDGQKYVRRGIAEELRLDCIQTTVKSPLSVIIWSCISVDGIAHLHVMDETLNARKY
ncbi:transposable element Tcb1 transposase [Trichonephila clavipes]|nr:transposable element Tcb1 transposase [Trichonephila clavipes]